MDVKRTYKSMGQNDYYQPHFLLLKFKWGGMKEKDNHK